MPVAPFASLVVILASSSDLIVDSFLVLLRADVGTRCWIMVLLTAYLKAGLPPEGEDSEMRDLRMEFCERGLGELYR